MSPDVPQILINREQLTKYNADIKLLGNCDDILVALSLAIGGSIKQKMIQGKIIFKSIFNTLFFVNLKIFFIFLEIFRNQIKNRSKRFI